MSKKHCIALATTLRQVRQTFPSEGPEHQVFFQTVQAIMRTCAAMSPRFDRAKFIRTIYAD